METPGGDSSKRTRRDLHGRGGFDRKNNNTLKSMLNGSQRLFDSLEGELKTGLSHVNVLVIGEEVLLQLVEGVVHHAHDITVEAVVQANGEAVDLTATHAR